MQPDRIGHVTALWRYPVKSMGGEQVQRLQVTSRGIAHDRSHALLSSGAPIGKPRVTSRERAALLRYRALMRGNTPHVLGPGGAYAADDPELIHELERTLPHGHRITLESEPDQRPYTDVRPVSLMSTQAVAALQQSFGSALDPVRFRSNIVLTFTEAFLDAAPSLPENALPRATLKIGGACELRVLERIPRCRMVTLDPHTGVGDPGVMRHLDRLYQGCFGVYAAVVQPGELRQGDSVCLVPRRATFPSEPPSNR